VISCWFHLKFLEYKITRENKMMKFDRRVVLSNDY
jgi:hypothetical protein